MRPSDPGAAPPARPALVLVAAGYLLQTAFSRPALEPMAGKVVDIAADMAEIQKYYAGISGKNPAKFADTTNKGE